MRTSQTRFPSTPLRASAAFARPWLTGSASLRLVLSARSRGPFQRPACVRRGAALERIRGPSPSLEREARIEHAALLATARGFALVVLLGRLRRIDESRERTLAVGGGVASKANCATISLHLTHRIVTASFCCSPIR